MERQRQRNRWIQKMAAAAISLVIGMELLTLPVFGKSLFTDMKGNEWYATDVAILAGNANEIIKGYPDGSFGARNTLTVDQFITMLVRAAGEKAEENSEYWAINYLNKAKEMGILKEGDFKDFRGEISREEMAVLMIRWLERKENLSGLDTSEVEKAILDFEAVGIHVRTAEMDALYKESVKKAYVLGLLTGYEDGNFKPQGILVRAEAATVVVRMLHADRRVAFKPEEIKAKNEAILAEHYYGGSKWMNPADASIPKLERAKVDRILTSGALDFSPYLHAIKQRNDYPKLSVDEIRSLVEYRRDSAPYQEQIKDVERLLMRRVSKEDAARVAEYLSKKTSPTTNLERATIAFMLKNDTYLVLIKENLNLEDVAYSVMVNIIYRDEKWKAETEKYTLENVRIRR